MIEYHGDLEMAVERVIHGHSTKAELAIIERKMRTIPQDAEDYDERHAELRAEWKKVSNLKNGTPDRAEPVKIGQTLTEWWPTASPQIRRELLLRYGVKMTASLTDDGPPIVVFDESSLLLSDITRDGLLVLPKAVLEPAT